MRSAACLLAAALAAPGFAQTGPYLAEVVADSAALRSGPGDQMPETGTLYRGARVVVDHEDGDNWLAVQPPNGQVSWINHKFLAPKDDQPATVVPRNAIVQADPDADIVQGRPGLGKPLDVRRSKVPDGTVVCVIGPKVDVGDTKWYPIAPPDGDFRYIPRSAVRVTKGQPVQAFVVRTPNPPPITPAGATDPLPAPAALPGPVSTAAATPGRGENWPNDPLWRQAEQADRDGSYARAEQLYLRLASDMNRPGGDAELANLCYTRVHAVREKQRQGGGRGTAGSLTSDRRDLPPAGGATDGKWAGPGKLREAGFRFDRKPTYALVTAQGRVICYALPGGRVDLDRYMGDEVELYGTVDYPGDLRGQGIMTVGTVRAGR